MAIVGNIAEDSGSLALRSTTWGMQVLLIAVGEPKGETLTTLSAGMVEMCGAKRVIEPSSAE